MSRADGKDSMAFEERFKLLLASGQASQRSVDATRKAIEMVEGHYGIPLTEEMGASLVNHLATTLKRLQDGAILSEASDVIWEEVADYPEELALAETIIVELQKLSNIPLARDETGFIAIHLCKIKIESSLD